MGKGESEFMGRQAWLTCGGGLTSFLAGTSVPLATHKRTQPFSVSQCSGTAGLTKARGGWLRGRMRLRVRDEAVRRVFDFDSAHQSSDGGCPLKTAINGATQPAVLLMIRYWPPPMLAGALFQNPLENLLTK